MTPVQQTMLRLSGYDSFNDMQLVMAEAKANDIILLAPTGTGKTAAFLLWLAPRLKRPTGLLQAVIVAPARELAQQTTQVVRKLLPDYRVLTFYGGHPLRDEINSLAGAPPDIVVATPGRLLDHLQRQTIDTSRTACVIIDEMDKCLDLGFLPDIKRIMKTLPKPKHFLLSSATMPSETDMPEIARRCEIVDFTVGDDKKPALEYIEIPSDQKDKIEALVSLLDSLPSGERAFIFVNHRQSAERVVDELRSRGFSAALYHGGMEQQDRELAVFSLTDRADNIIVATDLASRGLDIPLVENVVHYHLPPSAETYTHRNGRTARAGNTGRVFAIVTDSEDRPDFLITDRVWRPAESKTAAERTTGRSTVVLNIGKKNKISRGDILGFLTKKLAVDGKAIGKIQVADRYSAFTLPSDIAEDVVHRSHGEKIKGCRFVATVAP